MKIESVQSSQPERLSRGAVLEVTIAKVVFGGDGLARLPNGLVLFVPFTAVGDVATVRVVEARPSYARAKIVELRELGPGRARPVCPYYQRCGGCQYQHLTYAEECRLKEEQVREAFRRVARLPDAPIRPIRPSPREYGYRNRITVHAEAERVGFRGVGGRELIDVSHCPLAEPSVNAQLAELRASRPGPGHYSLRDAALPPSGFYQANAAQIEDLRELVAAALPAAGDLLLEGYCGGGFFTAAVAKRFRQVLAVENDPRTLRDAQRLGLTQVEWIEADVAQVLPQVLQAQAARATSVLLDPPREGLAVRLTEALMVYPVEHLAYLSCDPATLARDARMLASAYQLLRVEPIDLFPRTAQIECLSVWRRL